MLRERGCKYSCSKGILLSACSVIAEEITPAIRRGHANDSLLLYDKNHLRNSESGDLKAICIYVSVEIAALFTLGADEYSNLRWPSRVARRIMRRTWAQSFRGFLNYLPRKKSVLLSSS
jgi:hypothetical protein